MGREHCSLAMGEGAVKVLSCIQKLGLASYGTLLGTLHGGWTLILTADFDGV